MERDDYQLCYVEGGCWAWFANVPPCDVWGDDWNDAPHDCNAGTPYATDGQRFVKIAWDGTGYEVNGRHGTYLSVEQINSGDHPWLVDPGYGTTYPNRKASVPAGVTLAEFRRVIRADGGEVYEVASDGSSA